MCYSPRYMPLNDSAPVPGPGLKRVLGLPALVLYGIILIQPTAPMPLFGAAAVKAQGHVVTTILIGMVAMLFTAVGYGRMAKAYPSAGSAYAYVSREIHPAPGYLVGWGMIFDYVMNPIICVIWCSEAARNILPLPFWVFAVFFALLFTGMNLRGIEASTRTNAIIAAGLGVVIVLFLGAAIRYVLVPGRVGPTVLRPENFYPAHGFRRRGPGGVDLHRLRRHFDALRNCPRRGARSGSRCARTRQPIILCPNEYDGNQDATYPRTPGRTMSRGRVG